MIRARIASFLKAQQGATAVEYALVAGLISIAIIVGVLALSGALGTLFEDLATRVPAEDDAG